MIVSKSLTWLDSPTLITFEWVLFHVSGSQTHMTWLVFLNSIFKCFVLKRTCWVLYYQNRISVTLTNSPHWLKIEFDEKTEYVVVFLLLFTRLLSFWLGSIQTKHILHRQNACLSFELLPMRLIVFIMPFTSRLGYVNRFWLFFFLPSFPQNNGAT